ncbi:MAG TPA: hypothetical protein VFA07_05855 [Chthonomonadaceae bacterium]|nr:hypothetical protein [Chthonomonadaceae bacterium]
MANGCTSSTRNNIPYTLCTYTDVFEDVDETGVGPQNVQIFVEELTGLSSHANDNGLIRIFHIMAGGQIQFKRQAFIAFARDFRTHYDNMKKAVNSTLSLPLPDLPKHTPTWMKELQDHLEQSARRADVISSGGTGTTPCCAVIIAQIPNKRIIHIDAGCVPHIEGADENTLLTNPQYQSPQNQP